MAQFEDDDGDEDVVPAAVSANSGDDSDDDEIDTSAASPTPAPAVTPPPVNPMIAAYLQNKQDLADAQKKASMNQLIAGLARAGGTAAASTYGNTGGVNNGEFDALDQAAQAPVNAVLAQQKSEAQDIANQSNIQSAQRAQAAADPKSVQSLIARRLFEQNHPELSEDQKDDLQGASADDLSGSDKYDEVMSKIKSTQQTRQDSLDAKSEVVDQKRSDSQDKAYTAMRKDLESFRGNQSVQQAAVAIQNTNKALALTESEPTSQNLALLADEMGKVAMNGVPSESGQLALMPNNLSTKIAEMKSFLLSKPSSADVSEYLKNNQDYLKQVASISQAAVNSYRSNIAKGYKNRVKSDDYQSAVDDYNLGGSGPSSSSASPAAPKPPSGAPHGGQYPPGSTIKAKGELYTVGADGNTLIPLSE